MYGKKTWGGPVDPFILTKFLKQDGDNDPVASMVIFEWRDRNLVGIPDPDGYGNVSLYCYLSYARDMLTSWH